MTRTNPRVLVLGGTGFLGGYLLRRLPSSFPTVTTAARTAAPSPRDDRVEWLPTSIDPAAHESVRAVLDAARADVVVNAIGARRPVDAAAMTQVNTTLPHDLAALAEARGARVINVSTDGVFSGARGRYTEADVPDPMDAYGRSKLAGELPAPHLTLRTSFFGRNPRGAGVIEWLAAQRGRVPGYIDYRFSGIAAALLADLMVRAIETQLSGVYHIGGDSVSKCDVLRAAAARLRLDVEVAEVENGPVDRTLDSSAFFTAVGGRRPTLADSMEALLLCGELSRS